MTDFVDIQVNGYAGVTFNAEPVTAEQLQHVAQRLIADKVRAILPTVVTADLPTMRLRLTNLRKLIDQDSQLQRLMPAFHIEGPCLSPVEGYRGAHEPDVMVPASREVLESLLEAAGGPQRVAMVTLAPERDPGLKTTQWLTEQGVIVCGGHCDPARDLLLEAMQAGLRFFTHLGNGSAAMMDRHDNIINRVLSIDGLQASLVPDGQHLPFWLVRSWVQAYGHQRFVFTTDCTAAAGAPDGFRTRPGVTLDTSGLSPVCRLTGTPYLAGSAITMQHGWDNAQNHIGLSPQQTQALCCDQPAKLIEPWLRSNA